MKLHIITALSASIFLLTTACTVKQKSTGVITVDGHSFNYERTVLEQPTPYINAASDGIYYKIAFPDGTTRTAGGDELDSTAREDARRAVRDWLDTRKTRDERITKPTKAPANTAPPNSETEVKETTPDPGGM